MALITTAQLETRAGVRFSDTGNVIVTDWVPYLQEAYDIGNAYSPYWPWMQARSDVVSLSAGTNTVDLSGTSYESYRIASVHNLTDGYPLVPLFGTAAWRAQYPDPNTETGSPVNYRLYGVNLEVWPKPDHALTLSVEYSGTPAALSHASGGPLWPQEFVYSLVDGAIGRAYLDDGAEKFAGDYNSAFMAQLAKMEEALLSGARVETSPRILDTFFDW